jgi:hypothetical protein
LLEGDIELKNYSKYKLGENLGDIKTPFILSYHGLIGNGKKF